MITDGERYNKVIDVWTRTTNQVAEHLFEHLQRIQDGFNPVFMMADSGARGSKEQIRQLAGMRGLMAKPQKKLTGGTGEIIESPDHGQLPRRPVGSRILHLHARRAEGSGRHGAQDRRRRLPDPPSRRRGAGRGHPRWTTAAPFWACTCSDLKEGEEIIEPLRDRILGRVTSEDVFDPDTGDVLVEAGVLIDEEMADLIVSKGIDTWASAPCSPARPIAASAASATAATSRRARWSTSGEAVGVMAAQSIGEPGTQLTLRTFHIGGTASRIAAESEVVAKRDGIGPVRKRQTVDQPRRHT